MKFDLGAALKEVFVTDVRLSVSVTPAVTLFWEGPSRCFFRRKMLLKNMFVEVRERTLSGRKITWNFIDTT